MDLAPIIRVSASRINILLKTVFHPLIQEIGIDLGSANTVVCRKGQGIVRREPTVVAVDGSTSRVIACGEEAKRMLGRAPGNILVTRPLTQGIFADLEITEVMLHRLIAMTRDQHTLSSHAPRVMIAVHSEVSESEKYDLANLGQRIGARDILIIRKPIAAAIGCGFIMESSAIYVVLDIGGTTTGVSIIFLSTLVYSHSMEIAGDALDGAIIQFLKETHGLVVGELTAENIKIKIGSAFQMDQETSMEVMGRDLASGLPSTRTITSQEIRKALLEPLAFLIDSVWLALDKASQKLPKKLMCRCLVLTGGSARLTGLDMFLRSKTGLPVRVADDPINTIARGMERSLKNPKPLL